ncbi:Rv2578c family radical SAM protein [Pseudonocardia oroxyli]|uniref:DNA repair photolyase n=1 Tax=Pseudonocardia oroxyli TaxID=366584 RepID=A0A1G7IFQ2_PSEOR|nr:Rv2578c family radical SAM protein [Pseudonocardia oroxyli]SDF11445.1 DNA repair photolyase [Pseudonocardia oroxyli]
MRWSGQEPQQALPGLVRTVRAPEFAGVVFHEVEARSALNRVPGSSPMPFSWTVNPYRGCSHACVYCFARTTHTYLDLDAGRDFDSQIVVKVNVGGVLRRELARPRWAREPVAMGTNTDPYQRAEGRYRLMPGIVEALARSGTPLSVLTKGTVLARDLPLLAAAARDVPVGLGVSLALLDRDLQGRLEPGTPSPRARLDLVRRIADAGLDCGVMIAPVLPYLTDSREALDAVLAQVKEAGASGVSVLPLHLRPGTREWFLAWLAREYPPLVPRYERLYRRGAYADPQYRKALAARVRPLLRAHGLDRGEGVRRSAQDDGVSAGRVSAQAGFPASDVARQAPPAEHLAAPVVEQLTLL